MALLSWLIDPLALSFRQVELAVLAGSLVLRDRAAVARRSRRRARGVTLVVGYGVAVVAFYLAGDRPPG